MTFHENVKKFDVFSANLMVSWRLGHIQRAEIGVNY